MHVDEPVAVILAAGVGKRMKSDRPKVLHEVCGRPMIEYVLDAARGAGVRRQVVVVGHHAQDVRDALSAHSDLEFVLQDPPKGTAHAVMQTTEQLSGHSGPVLVLCGDTPLLRSESLSRLLEDQRTHSAACVVGTAETDANKGLGRIVRDEDGRFVRIVEEKDASADERAIREINTGCYAFDGKALFAALEKVRPDNTQREYYLTDCPEILADQGHTVVASRSFDIAEAKGVNTPDELEAVALVIGRRGDGVTG